jgi:hypothetical protein
MHKYARFTMAKTGKEPTMKLIQRGSMPKTKKRRARRKGV